jgi:hypothetical protein
VEGLDAITHESRAGTPLSARRPLPDCIYVAASARDSRYTRICVASVRHFYPDIRIRLLPGGRLQPGLAIELQRYWAVTPAFVPPAEFGWGFVKLEPLFGAAGETFLVLDSDTVVTGRVLDAWTDGDAPFVVDDERQSEADIKRLYYDWERVRGIDATGCPPQFVFNSGQWFGTAGVFTRDDFSPWVEWTMPRRLRYPDLFMPGDQGILNYVLNQKASLAGLRVERRPIMRWPSHGMEGLNVEAILKRTAPPIVVHWAGVKRARQRDMTGADLLAYFEREYYRVLPGGSARRILNAAHDAFAHWMRDIRTGARLAYRRLAVAQGRQ